MSYQQYEVTTGNLEEVREMVTPTDMRLSVRVGVILRTFDTNPEKTWVLIDPDANRAGINKGGLTHWGDVDGNSVRMDDDQDALESLTNQPSPPTYNWDCLDVVEASENTLVTDESERLRALQEFKNTNSILGYWVTPDFNDGDFDTEKDFIVDWTGFPRYVESRKGAGNPAPTEANDARRKGNKARQRVTILLDPDLLAQIDSKRGGTSRSDIANIALQNWLQK